jgi:hypothetical protein
MGLFDSFYKSATNIDSVSGREFEFLCASILRENGFSNVRVTQGSGDYGIDILAEKGGLLYGIQCKHYAGSVGVKAAQEAYSGKAYYKCDVAMVLTNNYFTQQAITFASETGVVLWDRDKLTQLVRTSNLQNQRGIRYSVPRKENRTRGASSGDMYSCLGKIIMAPVIIFIILMIIIPGKDKENEGEKSEPTVSEAGSSSVSVANSDISKISEGEIKMVIIAKNEANIRKGPSSKTEAVMTAKPGTVFIGTGNIEYADNGGLWYEIYINGEKTKTAWASEQIIKIVEEDE